MKLDCPDRLLSLLGLSLFLVAPATAAQEAATGWACGTVVDESFSYVVGVDLILLPALEPGGKDPEPVARLASDENGAFCFRDLPPGHYQLRLSRAGWALQPLRPVEIRAGLLNRLHPMEMELEPGEPRVSYQDSLDGMTESQARAIFERLLVQGDSSSLAELNRRLLPKRGPEIYLGRLAMGLDTKPLVDELLRQLDRGYLPPLKTARYLYVVGELADPRTRDRVVPLLLGKLRDARALPVPPNRPPSEENSTRYVSDFAMSGLVRLAGKEFDWKYGRPPLQNSSATARAQDWWRREIEKKEK
jgi:hypothetical protein